MAICDGAVVGEECEGDATACKAVWSLMRQNSKNTLSAGHLVLELNSEKNMNL